MIKSRSGRYAFIAALSMPLTNAAHASTGVIVAWGNNNVGQSAFNGSDTAIDIAVCGEQWSGSTFWVRPDGTVGSRGQFGGMPPQNLGSCVQVAAGYRHALALKSDGGVVGWGEAGYGTGGLEAAYRIPGTLGACSQIAAGGNNSAALKASGLPEVWGAFGGTTLGVGACKQIAVGSGTLAVLKVDGSVSVPACDVGNFGTSSVPQSLGPCTAIAVGDYHVVAIQESGTVVAWGFNYSGQCGAESERVGGSSSWNSDSRYGAYWVKTAIGPCKSVSASSQPADQGKSRNAAIKIDGSIAIWGGGGGSTVYPDPGACTKVVAGAAHSAAIQVPLPSITGVMPISGPAIGGTPITITGTDFFPYSNVLIGGTPATDVVVVSPTKITAVTPPGFPGPAEVKVNLGRATAFYYRPECGSDLDQDGEVTTADISIVLLDFGPCYSQSGAPSAPSPTPLADEPAQKPTQR